MQFRRELKFICTQRQIEILKARLKPVMRVDEHQKDACYRIRSLYFDDLQNSAFSDNDSGVDCRRKFRLRIYDSPADRICLEIKYKQHGDTKKEACLVPETFCRAVLRGKRIPWDPDSPGPLKSLYTEMNTNALRPQIIVDYERSAYVCPLGNVRITFDRNIAYSDRLGDFLEDSIPLVPVLPAGVHLLEVKYDELIPDYILQLLETDELSRTTFSKFYLACLARKGEYIW